MAYRWHVVNRLSNVNATELPELLDLDGGVFGISQEMAVQLGELQKHGNQERRVLDGVGFLDVSGKKRKNSGALGSWKLKMISG